MIPQPPRIEFVPVDERVSWLYPGFKDQRLDPAVPSWARLRSAPVLGDLPDEDTLLRRYAGDLALIVSTNPPYVNILLVPRLPVKQGPASKRKYKRLPRLLVAEGVDLFCNGEHLFNDLPPNMFWHPYKKSKVEWFGDTDVCRLKSIRVKEIFYGPFARFESVHTDALDLDICPSYSELNYFAWGYGTWLDNPAKTFMTQSYEQYLRAPLEVGHRVSVVSGSQHGRSGNLVKVQFNVVTMEHDASRLVEEYPERQLKRVFQTGDTVRVHSAVCMNHPNQEGWVVEARENEVTVIDAVTKTTVMFSID